MASIRVRVYSWRGGGDLFGVSEFDDLALALDGDADGEVAHDGHGVGR
ncbi:MAG: hypothetical protein ABI383_14100 [Acidobacteriaceae bacterium]